MLPPGMFLWSARAAVPARAGTATEPALGDFLSTEHTVTVTGFIIYFSLPMSPQTGQEHELIESMPLLEWFANNYKKFGATLEIVTDKSQEGSQFVKGFGGIGGKLQEENVFVIFSGWFDTLVPT